MPNRNTQTGGKDNTYFAPMRGVVVANDDPKMIGRVRVRVYSMHGDSASGIKDEELQWAFPVFPNAGYNSGTFVVPEVGSTVLVLFENGDSSKPIYIGGMYGTGKTKTTYVGNTKGRKRYQRVRVQEVPFEVQDLDTKMVYKSPKGSKIQINDHDTRESIMLVDPLGQVMGMVSPMTTDFSENNGHLEDTNVTKKLFSEWGGLFRKAIVLLKGLTGSKFKITSQNGESVVEAYAAGGKKAQMILDSEGKAHIKVGNVGVEIDNGMVTVSGGTVRLHGGNIDISGTTINLNGIVFINGKTQLPVSGGVNGSVVNINPNGAAVPYRPMRDIVVSEEEDETF